MAKLKLLNAELASVYGVPIQDTDEETILADYVDVRLWNAKAAHQHLEAAIRAGVYALSDSIESASTPAEEPQRTERSMKAATGE